MGMKLTNFARAKVAVAPTGTGGLSFSVEAGKGALFPNPGAGEYFYGCFKNASGTREIVKVEARATDSFTIATGGRAQDGTVAYASWAANDYFELGWYSKNIEEFSSAAAITNTPAGGVTATNVQAAIDELDAKKFAKTGGAITGLLSENQGADIVADATTDLGTATGNYLVVTHASGTLAVTSLGGATVPAGTVIETEFSIAAGTLSLTHHATNLRNITGADITIENGDVARWRKVHDTNAEWRMVGFERKSGKPLDSLPAGTILDFGGGSVPGGYLACNGSNVSRTTYAALFAAIGTTWGVGDGSTTFTLPDMRRKTAVGSGGTATGTLGNAVGNTGGAETHTLSASEMPSHTGHIDSVGSGNGYGYFVTYAAGVISYSNRGSGAAHNNLQPSAVVLKIIKT